MLRTSHIFCLPSTYKSEAVPLSIIEAMSVGCVIVVYDYKYLPSLVKADINGKVVSPLTPSRLAVELTDLSLNRKICKRISAYNHHFAYQNYSERHYQQQILEFFTGR